MRSNDGLLHGHPWVLNLRWLTWAPKPKHRDNLSYSLGSFSHYLISNKQNFLKIRPNPLCFIFQLAHHPIRHILHVFWKSKKFWSFDILISDQSTLWNMFWSFSFVSHIREKINYRRRILDAGILGLVLRWFSQLKKRINSFICHIRKNM